MRRGELRRSVTAYASSRAGGSRRAMLAPSILGEMIAGALADAVLVLHFAWIVFAIFGAPLIMVWRKLIWIHPPVLAWSVLITLVGWVCPLTPLEDHLRDLAGQEGYSGGFIEHWVERTIYPAGLTRGVQMGLGVALFAWNALVYAYVIQYLRKHDRRRG